MSLLEFRGFAGGAWAGEAYGVVDAPSALIVHEPAVDREYWRDTAQALAEAGRYVVRLAVEEVGPSADDLRAILGQMASRPVVVASAPLANAALMALSGEGSHLATGLVLVESFTKDGAVAATEVSQETAQAAPLQIPLLVVQGEEGGGALNLNVLKTRASHVSAVQLEADFLAPTDAFEAFNAVLIDFLEQHAPRAPIEFRNGSDARTLRDAMGCFATGVTIVTAFTEAGQPAGLTANSFTSVSLDPPLVLICVGKSASTLPALMAADRFAINVLHMGQQSTSNRFTRKDVDRFETVAWERGEFGPPLLTGSLANFECERHAVHEGGDHVMLVGRVLRARFEPHRDPLLYFRGKYRRLHMS